MNAARTRKLAAAVLLAVVSVTTVGATTAGPATTTVAGSDRWCC